VQNAAPIKGQVQIMNTPVFDHVTTALLKKSSQKNGAVAFVYLSSCTHTCAHIN